MIHSNDPAAQTRCSLSKLAMRRTAQVAALVVANALGVGATWAATPGGTTTKTVEQYFFEVTEVPITQNVETFSTTVDGFLAGGAAPVASFSFDASASDAAVLASFATLRHLLTSAAGTPLSFTGPSLDASSRSQVGTSVAGVNSAFDFDSGTVLNVSTVELVGEDTFQIPWSGRCTGLTELYSFCNTRTDPEAVYVAAGNTVLLTSADIQFSITRTVTTTNTFLTTQRYSIIGTPDIASPIPEPSTLLLMAPLMALVAFRTRGRARPA